MSIIGSNLLAGASGQGGAYEIERSLRFNDDDTAWLSKTFAGDGNLTTWTWSGWVKRSGGLGAIQHLFGWISLSGGNFQHTLGFDANNKLYFSQYNSILGGYLHNQTTEPVYRDVSAWYHVVAVYDTGNTTPGDRIRLYVNGERITSFSSNTTPTSGWEGYINDASYEHGIGLAGGGYVSNYFDGYMAEVNFVDGQALDHTSFGETDTTTGAWIPKRYGGSYGTNGFYLNFSDNSTVSALGTDTSGNGNNWTPTNFSVTAGAGNDSLEDTPTNNWCTLNPLDNPNTTYAASQDGNLVASLGTGAGTFLAGTMHTLGGKYYWECTPSIVGNGLSIGITYGSTTISDANLKAIFYAFNGNKRVFGTDSAYGASYTVSDVIGVAVDGVTGTIEFFKNNVSQGVITNSSIALQHFRPFVYNNTSSGSSLTVCNFGQRAFAYTPPTGFEALNTANLPEPTIKDGTNYFNTVLYTGTGSSNSITGVGFQPDWVWIKKRSASENHELQDSVRGATKRLALPGTASETTVATTISSFDSDGFTVVSDATTNQNTATYAAWNWKAGGSSSSNTDGNITSTVSANPTAGFSIVTYTGNGTDPATNTVTVGHGLSAKPAFIITKKRSSGTTDYGWSCWHKDLGAGYGIWLHLTNARNPSMWDGDTNHSSTVFSPADLNYNNESGQTYVNYVFAEVEGYSKFGSYTGNGSSDGPLINCGFRPSFFMLKNINLSNTRWIVMDATRDPSNVAIRVIAPSTALGEDASTSYWLADFVSNGVKLRYGADNEFNRSGDTFIFMAFAENPFKYANAR